MGIKHINFLMSNIEISTQNHRFSQFFQILLKVHIPFFSSIFKSIEPLDTSIWHVGYH
jgi:hypothetical protein